jgi:hypothetical protein
MHRKRDDRHPGTASDELDLASLPAPLRSAAFSARDPMLDLLEVLFADGEAVVLGPDGLCRFEELSRREAADTAILYAFDLIEHDGEVFASARSLTARLR